MSASSASSLRRERAERVRAAFALTTLALILALLLPALARAAKTAAAAKTAPATRDSGRLVHHVMIGDDGVQLGGEASQNVGDYDAGSSTVTIDGSGHKRVVVGPNGVEITHGNKEVHVNGPVVSVDGGDDDIVRVFEDAEVPPGRRVDGNVVAVFGSVTVHGQVTGSAVSVFGNVTLDSTAHVAEDAVAVGGTLNAAHGSTVGGESVSLGFLPIAWGLPALPILLGVMFLGWLSALFLGWLLHILFPDRMLRAAVTASRRTGLSFVMGLVSAPLMVIACVLLLITVLGIPIALLLPIAYWLLTWAGQLAATQVLGSKLMRRSLTERWSFAPLALGTLFIAGFFVVGAIFGSGSGVLSTAALFFDLLGLLMLTGLTVIGTGAFLVSRLGSQPADLFARPQAVGASGGTAIPPAPIAAPAAPPAAPIG